MDMLESSHHAFVRIGRPKTRFVMARRQHVRFADPELVPLLQAWCGMWNSFQELLPGGLPVLRR
eukprot:127364-Heterocapsa_arctica.AAC.1